MGEHHLTYTKNQRDFARKLRANQTNAERRLWQAIRKNQLGPKFRRQAPIGPFVIDFLSHQAKLSIELDGGQHAEMQTYDTNRTAFIESKGFHVLRFWNTDIFENLEGILMTIAQSIQHPHPDLPPQAREGAIDENTARAASTQVPAPITGEQPPHRRNHQKQNKQFNRNSAQLRAPHQTKTTPHFQT